MPRTHRSTVPIAERFLRYVGPPNANGCTLWTGGTTKGYGVIGTKRGQSNAYAHRLSYELANGPIPDGLLVLHKCDTPLCVNAAHLFLGTDADNVKDKFSKGRGLKGERVGGHKVTVADVATIRARYAAGGISQYALAREFGVSQSAISLIINGHNWEHVQ